MKTPRVASLDVPYATHPEEKHRITYYTWGDDAAPPVICIHGLTRNGRDFDFLADALSADYRVISLDMPGRSKSEWLKYPEEYNLAAYIANMLFLMDTLKLGAVDWIGTSMGGLLGMFMAATQPGRIKKLVLNDVGAEISAAALARIGSYVGKVMEFPSRSEAEKALRAIYAPFNIRDEATWQHFFDHDLQNNSDGTVRRNYDPAVAQTFSADPAQPNMELWEIWQKVACPVLVIRGAESDILLPETVEKMQATHAGLTLHTVPGAGHAPTLADATEINCIRDWLKAAS